MPSSATPPSPRPTDELSLVIVPVRFGKPSGDSVVLDVRRQYVQKFFDFFRSLAEGRMRLAGRNPCREYMKRRIYHHMGRNHLPIYRANHPLNGSLRYLHNLAFRLVALFHRPLLLERSYFGIGGASATTAG